MKNLTKILFIFTLICFFLPMKAQTYYDTQWKKIAENYSKGTYKSNLPLILEIQNRAIKEDNAIQLIKSLKAEFSIANLTNDDTKNDAASQFFKKLQSFDQKLKGENKLVYQVLLGDFFKDYYEQNDWEINQRTNINTSFTSTGKDFSQIETWSKLDFKNFFNQHFSQLEKQNTVLQNIKTSKYAEIFNQTENINYFPTFYDYNALQFIQFLSNENYFTKNELKENQTKVLSVFDDVISKNSGNSKLYFQHQKITDECSFTHCKDKQSQLIALYNSATEGDYKVLIAQEIIQNLQAQQKFEEALSWIEKVKKSYPKSPFLENIKNQENQILQPALKVQFEQNTVSNKPIHLVASHKNASEFSLNIYEVKSDYQGFMKYISNSWQKENFVNLKKTLVRKESYNLPATKDYKMHKTSVELKPLPSGIYVGEYLVEGKVQGNFYFIASQSRIIYQNKNDNQTVKNELKLVNRDNGKILPKEDLEFYEFVNGKISPKISLTTNETAVFKISESLDKEYYRSILVRQPKTNDFNILQIYGNQYYNEQKNDFKKQAQIFLDRAIYRPGQTVYYKVIATNLVEQKEKVLPNETIEIKLFDVNGEEISKQEKTTNEFGSFNGSFTLPQGKLNGQFSLRIDE
uniref:MG2 domain-containing protein n=1 Tax=Cloacibacterium sp. TaxID=1913682 RepID=UPI0035B0C2A9